MFTSNDKNYWNLACLGCMVGLCERWTITSTFPLPLSPHFHLNLVQYDGTYQNYNEESRSINQQLSKKIVLKNTDNESSMWGDLIPKILKGLEGVV